MEVYFLIVFFILGTIIGSFLNVCIVRWPLSQSIVFPASHCRHCEKPIFWFDNIPLISFLWLQGKCRHCQKAFSIRYFLVELLTGLSFVCWFLYHGLSWSLIPYLFLISCFIIAVFTDIEHRIIPDEITFMGLPLAFLSCFLIPGFLHIQDISILILGFKISIAVLMGIFVFQLMGVLKTKKYLVQEEWLFLLGLALVVLLQGVILFSPFLVFKKSSMMALCFSLQGMFIGGGILYAMGLMGEILISKRVVTPIDFKLLTDQGEALFQELIHFGVLNAEGNIQKKFLDMKEEDFILSEKFSMMKKDIYEIIQMCQQGGVMGGGDIKLLALSGAFLGWPLIVLSFLIAPFSGAIFGVISKIRTKSSAIAFGPHLVLGILIAIFFGDKIYKWLFLG